MQIGFDDSDCFMGMQESAILTRNAIQPYLLLIIWWNTVAIKETSEQRLKREILFN